MGNKTVTLRVPDELLARLDRHVAMKALQSGDRRWTRTGVTVEALEAYLELNDADQKRAARDALKGGK